MSTYWTDKNGINRCMICSAPQNQNEFDLDWLAAEIDKCKSWLDHEDNTTIASATCSLWWLSRLVTLQQIQFKIRPQEINIPAPSADDETQKTPQPKPGRE